MKFSFAVIASLALVLQAAALPAAVDDANAAGDLPAPVAATITASGPGGSHGQPPCPTRKESVRFLRGYNTNRTNHFYTADRKEFRNAVQNLGYAREGNAGRVFKKQVPFTYPLYRLYHPQVVNHFYTMNDNEARNFAYNYGFKREGIAAYIFPQQWCGSQPLYRAYSIRNWDHFYTTDKNEYSRAVSTLGFRAEGVVGYVLH